MIPIPVRLIGAVVALTLAAGSPAVSQQLELKIMAPAAPGGGWDQTARSMQQALVAAGIARSVQVTNVAGAGGSVGIAQFVNGAKGDGNQLMVNGFVMVGALAMNKSPVTLDQVTPIARLTEESQVIVVPANSPIKDAQGSCRGAEGRYRQGDLCRRLGRRRRPHHGGAVRRRGRRRRHEGELHAVLRRRRVAGGHPRRQGDRRHFRLRRVRRPDQGRQAARASA